MYEYVLFLIFSACFIFTVYNNYQTINYYVNRTFFHKENIQQIKNKMESLEKENSL